MPDVTLEAAGRALHARCPILGWMRWEQLSQAVRDEYIAKATEQQRDE